jgi:hypothetical protein
VRHTAAVPLSAEARRAALDEAAHRFHGLPRAAPDGSEHGGAVEDADVPAIVPPRGVPPPSPQLRLPPVGAIAPLSPEARRAALAEASRRYAGRNGSGAMAEVPSVIGGGVQAPALAEQIPEPTVASPAAALPAAVRHRSPPRRALPLHPHHPRVVAPLSAEDRRAALALAAQRLGRLPASSTAPHGHGHDEADAAVEELGLPDTPPLRVAAPLPSVRLSAAPQRPAWHDAQRAAPLPGPARAVRPLSSEERRAALSEASQRMARRDPVSFDDL